MKSPDAKFLKIMNDIGNLDLTSMDCLEVARTLILMNPRLTRDYASLEDAINILNQVILSELD